MSHATQYIIHLKMKSLYSFGFTRDPRESLRPLHVSITQTEKKD